MSALQWNVVVVVNHSRREILADAGALEVELWGFGADTATVTGRFNERTVAGGDLVKHWDFSEDRVKVAAAIPVDDEDAAHELARDLRVRPGVLALHDAWVRRLVVDGYRVLGNERRGESGSTN